MLSSLTRTQSRFSAMAPAGSHGTVDTNARRLSFQIASVGRPSTAFAIVVGPAGCFGAGGSPNPVRIDDRLAGAEIEVTPPPAGVPVIRA